MVALAALVLVVAWLTAGAMAVRSVSRIWLRHWVDRQLRGGASAALFVERPQRLLLASATAVALTVFVAGALIGRAAAGAGPGALARSIALYAMVLLLVGQLVPRALARRWSTSLVPVLLPVLRAADLVLCPLLWTVRRVSRPQHTADSPDLSTALV